MRNSRDGMGLHMAQLVRVVNVELRNVLKNDAFSPTETGVILCLATTEMDTAGQIARCMGVSRSLMSKTVDDLVRGGWIETRQDEKDRRVVRLCLLPKAEPAAEHCRELRERYFAAMFEGISEEDIAVFHRVVGQIWENMQRFIKEENAHAKGERR